MRRICWQLTAVKKISQWRVYWTRYRYPRWAWQLASAKPTVKYCNQQKSYNDQHLLNILGDLKIKLAVKSRSQLTRTCQAGTDIKIRLDGIKCFFEKHFLTQKFFHKIALDDPELVPCLSFFHFFCLFFFSFYLGSFYNHCNFLCALRLFPIFRNFFFPIFCTNLTALLTIGSCQKIF